MKNTCVTYLLTSLGDSEIESTINSAKEWCTKPNTIAGDLAKLGKLPITLTPSSSRDEWIKKSLDKYFLESPDNESIGDIDPKTERDKGKVDSDLKDKFKKGCEGLLNTGSTDSDYSKKKDKAEKWCVKYETLKEKSGKGNLKSAGDANKSSWKSKYDSNSESKPILKTFYEKGEASSESDDDLKKAKAVYNWCLIALNGSNTDSNRQTLETICLF